MLLVAGQSQQRRMQSEAWFTTAQRTAKLPVHVL